ncbi:hypothetical protein BDA99DRAFT_140170 [Phascolomyces articulosus]|uniref:Uncharacterized protein n=1 Tax=Phascolomyces articulosus TaxID=60185 RepID=A0AAD5JVH8_9FUNG|nr:hypothetical protein BDA99DRAFT_140170 [Phascolomyces articulosus]
MYNNSPLSSFTHIWMALVAIYLIILPHYHVYSYCIYNRLVDGTEFYIHQTGGHGKHKSMFTRFEHFRITSNQQECCPYDEKTCSDEADKNHEVRFWVSTMKKIIIIYMYPLNSIATNNITTFNYIKMQHSLNGITNQGYEITCPAGGYIIFGGTYNAPTFHVFYADDKSYPFRIIHEYRNKFLYAKHKNNSTTKGNENQTKYDEEDDKKEKGYENNGGDDNNNKHQLDSHPSNHNKEDIRLMDNQDNTKKNKADGDNEK